MTMLGVLISSCALCGQSTGNPLQFVSVGKDISKRAISSITQDCRGFIWIGTNSTGIYRFDGTNHKSYSHSLDNNSLVSNNSINCLFIDSEQRLWAGTDISLEVYNRNLDRFERIDLSKTLDFIPKNLLILSIAEDDSGNLLIGTHGQGMLKYDKSSGELMQIVYGENSFPDLRIYSIKKHLNGKYYLATTFGLMEWDTTKSELKKTVLTIDGRSTEINEPLETLLVDKDDNLWLGTYSNGITKVCVEFGLETMETFTITNAKILSMLQNKDRGILIGTENDGLFEIGVDGIVRNQYTYNKFDNNSLASNSIWSLFKDSQNRIWVGYYSKGVAMSDELYSKFDTLESLAGNENSLQASSVTGIVQDEKNRLWIGMDGGGIDVYDPDDRSLMHLGSGVDSYFFGLKNDDIQTIFIDTKQNIWVGSWNGGIYFLPEESRQFINYTMESTNGSMKSNRVLGFAEDSKGTLWIATFSGLHYYDPEKKRFSWLNLKWDSDGRSIDSELRTVLADSQDNIWFGTASELYKLKRKISGDFSVSGMSKYITDDVEGHPGLKDIQTIFEESKGKIWIGTDGGGLFQYHPKAEIISHFEAADGFGETSINAIAQSDDGAIWISGKSGITKLNHGNTASMNYTVDDGLLGNYFNNNAVLKDKNGILYFGSYEGLNYFDPMKIKANEQLPKVYFSDFRLFNEKITPADEKSPLEKVIVETNDVTLNHNQSVFTIEYSSISFTRPEKNQYAYYMEGIDKNWNFVGETRNVTYANLLPGDYTFKVKVANNDGVWNDTPISLHIKLLPPWWKTKLAYVVYALILSTLLFLTYLFLRNRIKEKQALSLERDMRLKEEELHQKKLQFFTNISHEFRTPLTLIKNPIEDLIDNKELNLPEEVRVKHEIIHKNSDRLSRLINELLDFRKLQSNKFLVQASELEVVTYVRQLVEYFEQESISRNIELNFTGPTIPFKVWADSVMLEKIMFNLLSNAFKVTPENGVIFVRVKKDKEPTILPLISSLTKVDTFSISVEDTGPGMSQTEHKNIFKRFYQIGALNKSYYGSTGIGLEMVKSFVELHRGRIDVQSKMGRGSKFTVIIPMGKDHFSDHEIKSSGIDTGALTSTNDSPNPDSLYDSNSIRQVDKEFTLLIVDDNAELRHYLEMELGREYNVLSAANGLDGLKTAKEKQPHLILTDVMMPKMDGFEMCKQIKNDMATSHIPLLMLTAKVMVDDKIKGIKQGADAYITKPFNMEVLKSTLVQLITSRRILFNKNYDGITTTSEENTTALDNVFVKRVLEYIRENIDDSDLGVENMASEFFLSRSQLYRKVKALTGLSVNEFIRKIRLQKAKQMLVEEDKNISEVAYQVGFSSASYFSKCFKAEFGYLPTEQVR
ncbi:hybrid sensor histidine kinase/response regulator transcription factor [Flagellimonas sp. 2504JD4-2]